MEIHKGTLKDTVDDISKIILEKELKTASLAHAFFVGLKEKLKEGAPKFVWNISEPFKNNQLSFVDISNSYEKVKVIDNTEVHGIFLLLSKLRLSYNFKLTKKNGYPESSSGFFGALIPKNTPKVGMSDELEITVDLTSRIGFDVLFQYSQDTNSYNHVQIFSGFDPQEAEEEQKEESVINEG